MPRSGLRETNGGAHPGYRDANSGKADFNRIYNQLDPRSYFSTLGALDYAIPERAAPVFLKLFKAYEASRAKDALTVLDIGCSYGINAAVLKYGCRMEELRARYGALDAEHAAPQDVLRADRKLFESREPKRELSVVGIDCAQFAASYAFWAGLLDDAIPENLEREDPSPQAAETLARCDLVISTGVVGYVTERTFERIAACQPTNEMPWIASFVLRMFDYDPIAASLKRYGYATEKLAGRVFRQRRFADADEQRHVEEQLAAKGISPKGLERDGHYLAELYLSRPEAEARAQPLDKIVSAG